MFMSSPFFALFVVPCGGSQFPTLPAHAYTLIGQCNHCSSFDAAVMDQTTAQSLKNKLYAFS